MKLAHTELDLLERRAIEDMLHAKVPVDQIAGRLGRFTVLLKMDCDFLN